MTKTKTGNAKAKVRERETRGSKSTPNGTTTEPTATTAPVAPARAQGSTAWLPLRRPAEDASEEVWAAYHAERKRRKVLKALRRGRIARREQPHDPRACSMCGAVPERELDINIGEVADRAMMSHSHVYRVLSPNVAERRGLKTLTTLRRIAHDGLGITLDELATIVLDG
jgi:hypothetical protein